MSAPLNKVGLCNRALAKFGAGAITSLTQLEPPGPACALVYDTTIDGLLAEHPWSFTKTTAPLAALAVVKSGQPAPSPGPVLTVDTSGFNEAGWRYAFALPASLLEPPVAYLADPRRADWPLRHFEVQGQTLYCDRSAVWAVVRQRADESVWPPYFVSAAVACLAAELIMTVSGNSGLAEALKAAAWGTPGEDRRGGALGQAKRIDSRATGTKVIRQNPLADARYM